MSCVCCGTCWLCICGVSACMWCVMCTCRRCVCGPWPCSEHKSCQLCPGAVGQPCLPENTCIYSLGSSPHLCSLKYLTQKTSTELLAPPSRTQASKHRPVPRRACLLGAPGLVARVSTRSSHGQSRSVRRGPGPRFMHVSTCMCVCAGFWPARPAGEREKRRDTELRNWPRPVPSTPAATPFGSQTGRGAESPSPTPHHVYCWVWHNLPDTPHSHLTES